MSLPLEKFSMEYSDDLPQVITAGSSVREVQDEFQFGLQDGEEFEVYFKKETPVVSMEMAGRQYTVPLNSAFKFSVLYNPNNDDLGAARRGYVYETVADLIKADPIPSVVYVGEECTTSKKKSGGEIIKKGSVIIIQGAVTGKSRFGKVRMLACIRMGDDTAKKLYLKKKCKGSFSTQEDLLLFPLSVLLKHIKLPVTTSLYYNDVPHPQFRSKVGCITTGEPTTQHSFIVSTSAALTPPSSPQKLIELCTSLQIEFINIAIISEEREAQLKERREMILETITPEDVELMYTVHREDQLQKNLLLPVNNNDWIHEIIAIDRTIYEPVVIPRTHTRSSRRCTSTLIASPVKGEEKAPPIPPKRRHSSLGAYQSSEDRRLATTFCDAYDNIVVMEESSANLYDNNDDDYTKVLSAPCTSETSVIPQDNPAYSSFSEQQSEIGNYGLINLMLFIAIIDLSSHFDVMDLSGLSTTATETSLISQGDSDEACYGILL